jgi:hypothetical protein
MCLYMHIYIYTCICVHVAFERSRPVLVQLPSHSSLTGGLIHDADYERGSYFLERGCLTRTVNDMIDSLVLWISLAVG